MIVFNFDPTSGIHVDTSAEGETKIRFDERTLGITGPEEGSGYIITNDWNDRHFTLVFNENSVLYHLTKEGNTESRNRSGARSMARAEFTAELYGYLRFLAPPRHVQEVDLDIVGMIDFDAVKNYLYDRGVVVDTDVGISVDNDKEQELVDELNENPAKLGSFYQEVLDAVPFEEVRETGEIVFVKPTTGGLDLIFLYPDDYVGVVGLVDLYNGLSTGGGSQIMDHVVRSIEMP